MNWMDSVYLFNKDVKSGKTYDDFKDKQINLLYDMIKYNEDDKMILYDRILKFIENNGYFRTYNQCCMRWCYSMDKSVFNPIKEELFFEYMVNLVKNLSFTKAQFNFKMTNIL